MSDPAPAAPLVRLEVAGGVATITLDSPTTRNALSAAVRTQLLGALDVAAADPAVRVLVLTHRGPVFCSGMDLKEEAVAGPDQQGVRELPAILRRITRCPKPVLARVAGPARAGGIGIMAAADIVVTVPTATFAFSEVRIGLIPAVITVPVLYRVAPAAARELLLTGEVFDAARALAIGLVNAVEEDLDGAVQRYLTSLLAVSAAQFATDEAREGGRSFAEKRPAAWVTG